MSCSRSAHLWAIADFVACYSVADPEGRRGYVATQLTCWTLLMLSPAVKCCGSPGGKGYAATWPNHGSLLGFCPPL